MRVDWWTLAFQTVNVLILIWLLSRYLYQPLVAIIDRRQREMNKLLADASAARQAASDARVEVSRIESEIKAGRDALIGQATADAQAHRVELLAQASRDVDKLRADAAAAIARERAAAQNALIECASALAIDIAIRLLNRVDRVASLDGFLRDLQQQIAELAPQTRAMLGQADTNNALEVVTASPLSDAVADRVSRILQEALGSPLEFVFRDDPALIAGIELRTQHVVLRNSWKADLDRIREELKRDREQSDRFAPLARTGEENRSGG